MIYTIPKINSAITTSGNYDITLTQFIVLTADSDILSFEAAKLLRDEIKAHHNFSPEIIKLKTLSSIPGAIYLQFRQEKENNIDVKHSPMFNDESYSLSITPENIIITAGTSTGHLWAIQTLRQLIRTHHLQLPAIEINDEPAMLYRGILIDLARRKVPTLKTLLELVDLMSFMKLNMLQLQIEHTFLFATHPKIGKNCGSLTPDEIITLDVHCKKRGVELVPMLQSFGHMRNILMYDEYKDLAEDELAQWSLCPTDPRSIEFLDSLYNEFLPCFSSKLINIGCDETIDLGRKRGKSYPECQRIGQGRVYLNFLLSIHKLITSKYNKQIMCWGDILLHYPDLIPEIPSDMIMLNWDYFWKEDFESVKTFANNNAKQIICPGTNSWNTIFPRIDMGWKNVANFTRDGKAVNAIGMLNTDWGDGGHYNLQGGSLYSYAHGADCAWASEPNNRDLFNQSFSKIIIGRYGDEITDAINILGSAVCMPEIVEYNNTLTPEMLFYTPFENEKLMKIPIIALENLSLIADESVTAFSNADNTNIPEDIRDMIWEAKAVSFAARKTICLRMISDGQVTLENRKNIEFTLVELQHENAEIIFKFNERWLKRNKISEIDYPISRMQHSEHGINRCIEWIRKFVPGVDMPEIQPFKNPWKEDMSTTWMEYGQDI
jgi:hexosaminidase